MQNQGRQKILTALFLTAKNTVQIQSSTEPQHSKQELTCFLVSVLSYEVGGSDEKAHLKRSLGCSLLEDNSPFMYLIPI